MPHLPRLFALLAGAAFALPIMAQPRVYVGLDAGYTQGAAGGSSGATTAPSIGLRWGRLAAEVRPAEYAYSVSEGRYCDGELGAPGAACGHATQSSLSSALEVAYALPVRGPLAVTAGAGVRARWYERWHAYRSNLEGISGGTGWERPHLALGARYDLSERLSVALRTETQVFRVTGYPDDTGLADSNLQPQVSRATLGLTFRFGR